MFIRYGTLSKFMLLSKKNYFWGLPAFEFPYERKRKRKGSSTFSMIHCYWYDDEHTKNNVCEYDKIWISVTNTAFNNSPKYVLNHLFLSKYIISQKCREYIQTIETDTKNKMFKQQWYVSNSCYVLDINKFIDARYRVWFSYMLMVSEVCQVTRTEMSLIVRLMIFQSYYSASRR